MFKGHVPGIDFDRRAVLAHMGHRRAKVDVVDLVQGAGLCDLHRKGGDPVHLGRGKDGRAGKSPSPIDDHPHAKALAFVVRKALDHAVLDVDLLGPADQYADVCIACALNLCQIQGPFCECSQGRSSFFIDDCSTWGSPPCLSSRPTKPGSKPIWSNSRYPSASWGCSSTVSWAQVR